MSSSSLDIVRSIGAAWERGEIVGESTARFADPEIEIAVVGGPEPSTRTGLADATPGIEDFLSVWEDYRVHVEEYRELDNERVLLVGHVTGRGKNSRVEVAQDRASLFFIRDGKVTKLVMYWDRDRAFADLGLAPEAP